MSSASMTDHVGYLLKQLQHAVRARLDKGLRPLGVSAAQYALLAALLELEMASGAELARRCFVTPQTVTTLIAALERAGSIERSPSDRHGRVIEVRLTAKGRELLERAHAIAISIEDDFLADLAPDERRVLGAMLKSCVDRMGVR